MLEILKSIAPTLATALAGPLAGTAVSFLASKLGVDASVVEQTVAGMKPEQLVQMKQMDLDFQKFMAENGIKIDLAQIQVNQEEAKSGNWFVSGWRPAVGWIGALSLGYVGLLEPFLRFIAQVGFRYSGTFPVIDTSLTMQVLVGILGLGAIRMNEKVKGVSR